MVHVLLVGNGAREHIIAKKLIENDATVTAFMSQMNPGIEKCSKHQIIGSLTDFSKLSHLKQVDMAIIGPEVPLAHGITDFLQDSLEIPVIGPTQESAKIETSKAYCRSLLSKYHIPGNPLYKICTNSQDVKNFLKQTVKLVVKPDGLTGGKGVKLQGEHLHSKQEILTYAETCIRNDGKVLLEEQLQGTEFTLQAFSDGKRLSFMPLVRDYKRAYDNDSGPNTGSMGSYTHSNHSLSYLDSSTIEHAKQIMYHTINAVYKDSQHYFQGILYGQFMLTSTGVRLIEYNVRFGDPEAINVLSLLKSNLINIGQQITDQQLSDAEFHSEATVCVYLVPEGYPTNPIRDQPLEIDEPEDIDIFYASVYQKNQKIYTTGSRSIALLGKGPNVPEARKKVYSNINKVSGKLRYRKDIAEKIS